MRKLLGVMASCACLLSVPALAAEGGSKGQVFELKGPEDKPIALFSKDVQKKEGLTVSTSVYTDPAGKELVREVTELEKAGDKDRVKSYKISQKQLGAEGVVEVKEGKAHFSYTRDGKTKTSQESVGEDFIVGPFIVDYIQRYWSEISGGKKIKARLAVPDRQETVGFEYTREGEEDVNGQKTVVVKMKPSSIIISALVDPLRFYFTPDGKRLIQMRGRTQVKRQDGSKFKDMDAKTNYD